MWELNPVSSETKEGESGCFWVTERNVQRPWHIEGTEKARVTEEQDQEKRAEELQGGQKNKRVRTRGHRGV